MTSETGPAGRVLAEASSRNEGLGHENLGPLSESHGFLSRRRPQHDLPPPYDAWVAALDELPELCRSLRVRARLEELPVLDASAGSLDDRDLLRAASVLGLLAHAYNNVPMRPPERLPDAIVRPWLQTAERLGRPALTLTNTDFIFDNWVVVDPSAPDLMCVENLRLLDPIWENPQAANFILVLVELLARSAPLVGASVRAQDACLRGDEDGLKAELASMTDTVRRLTRESLPKIDANARAGPRRVDPVVWTKLFAMIPLPVSGAPDDVRNASGAETPYFHLLDVILERRAYETQLGHEALRFRASHPPHWRAFIAAVGEPSIAGYVRERGDAELSSVLGELADAYHGPRGLLARHRLKAFAYMEAAFKTGRTSTVTGFSGLFEDRAWEAVDASFEEARLERVRSSAAPATGERADGRPPDAQVAVRDLARQYGYGEDTVPIPARRGGIDRAELALHNDPKESMWMAIDGRVYDLTRFGEIHPGGEKLIRSFAGMDATATYRLVAHDRDPAVEALLGLFEIGSLHPADDERWARTLNVLVEIENAHRLDTSIRDELPLSAFRLQFALEAHRRFLEQTIAIVCRRIGELDAAVDAEHVLSGAEARAAAERSGELERTLERDGGTVALDAALQALHRANAAYLNRAKRLVAERTPLDAFPELTRAHLAAVGADEFSPVGRS